MASGAVYGSAKNHPELAHILLLHQFQFAGLLDLDGVLVTANAPALALTAEGTPGSNLGIPFWTNAWHSHHSLPAGTSESMKEAFAKACTGEFVRFETQVYTKLGHMDLDFSLNPVFDPPGSKNVVYVVAEGRDVTEKKKIDRELERKNAELAELYRKLSEADQRRSQFFANLSHGFLQRLLQRSDLDAHVRRDLEIVSLNARTLLRQVNDLLDLSKLDAGRLQAHYERVDLRKLLEYALDHLGSLAHSKQIQLRLTAPDDLPLVEVDSEKILRVILNLLSNAAKFTPQAGTIHLRVQLEGDMVAMSVGDSGPGVPAHFRTSLFKRFEQAQTSDTRAHTGTGLGLSIVKDFAELHGGSVRCAEEAAPEGGALFVVKLPVHAPSGIAVSAQDTALQSPGLHSAARNAVADLETRQTEEAPELPASSVPAELPTSPVPSDAPQTDLQRPLVLVVEDNQDLREFIASVLQPDMRVATAKNGLEGLNQALAVQPDVILSDVQMPVMSGDTMVLKMRGMPQLRGVPIVMLTARADEALRLRMLSAGVQEFLSKPFSVPELRVRLRNVAQMKVARSRLQAELQSTADNVAELTGLLADNVVKLRAALREAEQTQRMKDDFLLTLSHELRTPLNGIVGFTDMLKSMFSAGGPVAAADALPSLDVIEQCAWSQSRLVDDLLDASRLITGRLSLDLSVVAIGQVLRSAVESLAKQVAEKQLRLSLQLPPEPGASHLSVHGDAVRLRQVFWNILNNACKFTPKGGTIQVTLACEGPHALVTVTDSGIGVAPGDIGRLFRRFGQLETSTTRKYGGLGIGLALAKGIVDLHDGEIAAVSDGPGRGLTIAVKLPLLPSAEDTPVPSGPKEDSAAGQLTGCHVLAADDDPTSLAVLKSILTRAGAEVRAFLVPRELLTSDAADPDWADLVVTDISMPELDGFGLRAALSPRLRTKVIAATAHASETERQTILDAGFRECLGKPLRGARVIKAIAELRKQLLPRR